MHTKSFTYAVLVGSWLAAGGSLFASDPAGFISLFNGQDLSGWEGNPQLWSVREGAITGATTADRPLKENTFLIWRAGTVENFELRLKYRLQGGNSGIQYRSRDQGNWVVGGYQADIEAGTNFTGILYEERGRGILALRGEKVTIGPDGKKQVTGSVGTAGDIQAAIKPNDWNEYVLVVKGNHLLHQVNGKTTVDVTDQQEAKAAKSGILALQVHVGPPMTVQFKDLQLKRLP
jgi:hypothetical protein